MKLIIFLIFVAGFGPSTLIRLYPDAMTKILCGGLCNKAAGGVCTKRPSSLEGDRYYCNCLNAVNFPQNNSGSYCNEPGCLHTTCAFNEKCENVKSPKIGGPFGECVAAVCDAHCNETMEEVCVFEESGKPNYCCADCDPNRCHVEGGCNEAVGGMCKTPGFFFNEEDACYCGEVDNYPLSNVGSNCNESYEDARKRIRMKTQQESRESYLQILQEIFNSTWHGQAREGLNRFSFWAFWGARREFSFTGARGLREIPSTWQPWPRLHYIRNKASYDIGMVTLRNDRFGLLKEYEAAGKAANRTEATFDKLLTFKIRFRYLYLAQEVSTRMTGEELCWRYGCPEHSQCVPHTWGRTCKCDPGYIGNVWGCTRLCKTGNGETYTMNGPTITYDHGARPCLFWTEAYKRYYPKHSEKQMGNFASFFPDNVTHLVSIRNYCRLPIDDEGALFDQRRPWCFVEDDAGKVVIDWCYVPDC